MDSLKTLQIVSKDNQILLLKEDKTSLNTMLLSSENEIQHRIQLQDLANKNIESLSAQNKKLNRQSSLQKILIPTTFVVGGFIGYKIIK